MTEFSAAIRNLVKIADHNVAVLLDDDMNVLLLQFLELGIFDCV